MDAAALIARLGPAVATFLAAVVSAVVPFVYIEVYLVAAVAFVPDGPATWALGTMAAVGQMVGKSALYWSARGVTGSGAASNNGNAHGRGLRQRIAAMNPVAVNGLAFTSALLGFPPMILVAPAAGAAAISFWPFALAGFAGRVLRFTALVMAAAGIERVFAGG
jgi:membrane protein YqaA with SNARE-associated domain